MDESAQMAARRSAGRLGLGFFLMLALVTAAQLAVRLLLLQFAPGALRQEWVTWALMLIQYVVGIPVVLLCTRKTPGQPPERASFPIRRMAEYFVAGYALMYLGSLLGTQVGDWLSRLLGRGVGGNIEGLVTGSSFWLNLFLVTLIAPVVEEFLFRKVIVDRLKPFGEKAAVLTSALMFGLFHGNVYQVFYALAVGIILGLAYVRSGRLRFSILIHVLINGLGSLVATGVLAVHQNWLTYLYTTAILSLTAAGLVFLLADRGNFRFRRREEDLPPGVWQRSILRSPGMGLFYLGCAALFAVNL